MTVLVTLWFSNPSLSSLSGVVTLRQLKRVSYEGKSSSNKIKMLSMYREDRYKSCWKEFVTLSWTVIYCLCIKSHLKPISNILIQLVVSVICIVSHTKSSYVLKSLLSGLANNKELGRVSPIMVKRCVRNSGNLRLRVMRAKYNLNFPPITLEIGQGRVLTEPSSFRSPFESSPILPIHVSSWLFCDFLSSSSNFRLLLWYFSKWCDQSVSAEIA